MAASPPFQLSIPETALADLKARLAMTRFPDQAPDGPWAYGSDLEYMRTLVGYWNDSFDWRAQEAALNAYPQFKVKLHDIDVHYLHVPGQGPSPMPLLLMHGWPGSVFEFIDIIPRLTDPARFRGAHPQNLIGIHVNLLAVLRDLQPRPSPTEEERRYYEEQSTWLREETGYQWIQGTKPQTLAYALTDAPVGRPTPAPAE
jgi:hypothetical protein